MAVTVTTQTVDAVLGTDITAAGAELVPAPTTGKERIASLVFTNVNAVGGADATIDISRFDGTTHFYGLGKNVPVKVGQPVILRDVLVKPGKALRSRASAAATVHVAVDYFEQTVS